MSVDDPNMTREEYESLTPLQQIIEDLKWVVKCQSGKGWYHSKNEDMIGCAGCVNTVNLAISKLEES